MSYLLAALLACEWSEPMDGPSGAPQPLAATDDREEGTEPLDPNKASAVSLMPTMIDFRNCTATIAEESRGQSATVRILEPNVFVRTESNSPFESYASDVLLNVAVGAQMNVPCHLWALEPREGAYYDARWLVPPTGMTYPPPISDGSGIVRVKYEATVHKTIIRLGQTDSSATPYFLKVTREWREIRVPKGEAGIGLLVESNGKLDIFTVPNGAALPLREVTGGFSLDAETTTSRP